MEFKISKQNHSISDNYLRILNELNNEAKKQGFKYDVLVNASKLSKASISLFINHKQVNYDLLNMYAGLLGYNLYLQIEKYNKVDLLEN